MPLKQGRNPMCHKGLNCLSGKKINLIMECWEKACNPSRLYFLNV